MPAKTLIKGGYVVTMDPEIGELVEGDVLIVEGRIAAVAPSIASGDAEVFDAAGAIVCPGMIDGHRHLWQTLLRGVAVDWSLPEYMVEARSMYCGCFDEDAAYLSNHLGGLESLAAGITTIVDHSHLQVTAEIGMALAQGLCDSRVGGVFCYALQNVPDFSKEGAVDSEAIRDLLLRAPDEWHDANAAHIRDALFSERSARMRFGVALPESSPFVPPPVLQAFLSRAMALVPSLITAHWIGGGSQESFSPFTERRYGNTHLSLTHCNHASDAELDAFANARIGICTTPDIECGMGAGPLAARRFVGAGGAASLGTDLSSYLRADMLQQARLALQAERMALAGATGKLPVKVGLQARQAFDLLTLTGARSIGLDGEIGSLTPGKRGDAVVVRPDPLGSAPWRDPFATLLFYTSPADVEVVLVEGEVVKCDGRLVGVDIEDLARRAAKARDRVQSRHDQLPRHALQQVWAGMFG